MAQEFPASPPADREPGARPATGAYTLLTLTALIWAGNAVAGKWAVGQVSPFALTSLRWLVACAALMPLAWRQVAREGRLLLPSWRRILLMGGCGYTAFNALFYVAGAYTSATNLTLFQGSIPIVVLAFSFLVYRTPVGLIQGIGVLFTLMGVALAATHGDPEVLRTLAFNRGDLFMLVACLLYAGYTVALRSRPAVSGMTFFTALAVAALLTSLPLLAFEWATDRLIWPTPLGWGIVVFVGLGPSLISQLFFMRGVEQIGPNRAGVFVNLVPVFGAFLAVALVGEPFRLDNALALVLVLSGIFIAERLGRRGRT
ncbi:DMT family transporter [Methylobacterium planeticum]|uniref:DMT family transporter n=1 Tax=Methylobacterium planeticum TaxID=2615211 RepID=A0A6N6MQU4_9HYPH|nr:DMT family transporter [Methylobacterium planeticum]KAB1072460.1 DMT family transporter [Methylobacterium planeticum]